MKKLLFTSFLLMTICLLGAQTSSTSLNWDSTHRPNNFKLKVEQFRSYPNSSTDIIFLGNSITAGTDWNELLGLNYGRNRGISGDITFGVLERLSEITEGHPAKIFILIGINDISRNIPDEYILNNHRKIIEYIKIHSPKTKIYLQTLLPVNNTFTQFKNHYNKDEHILAVNNGLKALAASEKITLIDLHSKFLDAEGRLDKQYTKDGLHLTPAGYKHWSSILKPYLQ